MVSATNKLNITITFNQRLFLLLLIICFGLIYKSVGMAALAVYFITSSLLAIVIIILSTDDSLFRNVLLLSLLIRIMFALIQTYTSIDLPGAGSDSNMFERYAWENAQAWFLCQPGVMTTGAFYYSAFIGGIYYFFGRVPFIPQLINISLGLFTIWIIYSLTTVMTGSRRTSLIASIITAFFPTLISFSSILLREMIIITFSLLSFYLLVHWLNRGGYLSMIMSFCAIVIAAIFHGAIILVSWVQVIFFSFYNPIEKKFKLNNMHTIVVVVIIVFIALLFGIEIITYKAPRDLFSYASLESFQKIVGERTIGRTHYLNGFIPQNYFDVLWHTPIRVLYFMLTPFPWMVKTISDLLVLTEVLVYLFLLYYSILGYRKLLDNNKAAAISMLLIIISILVLFAWGSVNYGTAWRHRAKIAPYLIVMASAGLAANPHCKKLFPDNNDNQDVIK